MGKNIKNKNMNSKKDVIAKEKNNFKLNKETLLMIFNKCYFVIEFILSLIFAYGGFKVIYYKKYFSFVHGSYFFMTSFVAILLLVMVIYSICKNHKVLEKMFLTFAIPIGLLYLSFLLPAYVPDEQAHIFRAYDISLGNIITDFEVQREYIPQDVIALERPIKYYRELPAKLQENTNHNSPKEELFNSAEAYSFIMYTFSSVVCLISRIFSLNAYVMVYLARLLNYVFFLVLGYYTIKILPFGKLVMFVYMLNPILLQEAMSVSADSFINATALLFIAYSLYLLFNKESLTIKDKVIYTLLVICVSFSKYVYFPIVLIGVLNYFKNKKGKSKENKKDNFFVIMIVLAIFLALASCYIGMQYKDVRSYVIDNNVNSTEQIKFILKNPIKYIGTIINTIIEKHEIYMYQFLGYNLGLLEIEGVKIISIIYLFILFISPFLEKNQNALNFYQKIWLCLIVVGIFVLVLTGLYIGWTAVGENLIQGVQGRYFIPIAILVSLCLVTKNKYIEFKYTNVVIAISLCLVNYVGVASIIKYFL